MAGEEREEERACQTVCRCQIFLFGNSPPATSSTSTQHTQWRTRANNEWNTTSDASFRSYRWCRAWASWKHEGKKGEQTISQLIYPSSWFIWLRPKIPRPITHSNHRHLFPYQQAHGISYILFLSAPYHNLGAFQRYRKTHSSSSVLLEHIQIMYTQFTYLVCS